MTPRPIAFALTLAGIFFAVGCATTPMSNTPTVARPIPGSDTIPIPIDELGKRTYRSIEGGLFPGGTNTPPPDYAAAGIANRNSIRPLDVNGFPGGSGHIVLMSIGSQSLSAAWCSRSSAPPCDSRSLSGRAVSDPSVNHGSLVIVNGAIAGAGLGAWSGSSAPNYARIRDTRLAPLGLSENQVQVIVLVVADSMAPLPVIASPSDEAPAIARLSATIRALKTHYPNLKLLFISPSGYQGSIGDEPAAYEYGFVVKWVIESQIRERQGRPPIQEVGPLLRGVSDAWVSWGPYRWSSGEALFSFFRDSQDTRCWFLAGPVCG